MRPIEQYYPKSIFTRRYPDFEAAAEGLEAAARRLCELLKAFPEEDLRVAVSPAKWSPAQVADHLVLVNEMLTGSVSRACDGEDPLVLPQGYLSDEGKAVSPPQGEPRTGRERKDLLADVPRAAAGLIAQVERARELGRLDRIGLVHSFFGEMTALECLQLAAWHMVRHLRKLDQGQG